MVLSPSLLRPTQWNLVLCARLSVHVYLDSWSVSSDGGPVHRCEAVLPSEVDVGSSGQEGSDALVVAVAAACQTEGRVCGCAEEKRRKGWK